jgi:hypothetical protein
MADVKVPPLLHKMSVSSQKAWYKKNNMELPGHLSGGEGKSAAQAKKDVGEINKAKAKEDRLKMIAAAAKKVVKPSSDRVRAMRHNADAWGGGLGGGLDRNRDIVSFVRSGGYIKAGRLGEEASLEEEKVNHREFATAGIMHPDMAHAPRMKAGNYTDFYSRKNGDKLEGKILSNDHKTVRIEHEGKVHKFDVRRSIPKPMYEEEVELEEAATQPSDKEIRMARGIAFGKRYKGGNMTAATNAIEKIRQGLSDHPKVAAALRSANEEKEMSHGKKLAKKVMAQQSTHPISQRMGEESVVEEKDEREYGYEGDMAMSQLKSIIANAQKLHDMLEPETDLPEWVQSKITLAEDYVVTAANYCAGDLEESVNEEVEQIDEKYMGFKAVQKAVAAKGARNPAAVAAYIGRKKYGKEKFQAMAAAGKKHTNEEVVVEAEGKTPETETEVNLAKKSGDPKKITYGDVIKARIQSAKNKALKKGE